MPLGKKNRPSSAGAKLETQNMLSNIGPTEKSQKCPDWQEKELLRQEPRRHSIALGDTAKLSMRQRHGGDLANKLYELKMEHVVSYDNLKHLKMAFDEFAKAGIKKLDYPQFRSVVKKCSGLHAVKNAQIQQLFMKIDYTGDGKIEWHEFCTYMHLEYKEKEGTVRRSTMATFTLPAKKMHLSRGEPVLEIQAAHDGTIVTVREDGVVNYWSPKLQLKNNKNVFPERHISQTQKRATDFVFMTEYDKLIIGTGAREIQIYEFSSLEPCCQISALETVPLNLCTGPDKCLILYGDTQGCVNILIMKSVSETLRLWKKSPQVENMPNISLDHAVQFPNITYLRWKVHQDWVSKVKYFHSIPAIISASNHRDSALVIGCLLPSADIHQQMNDVCGEGKPKKIQIPSSPQLRPAGDQKVFAVGKGVMSFDFSKSENLLVTGGMDKLLRMWNPYMPERPTGTLKGHLAPIFYVCIASEEGHIFSVSRDNTAKIWNIQDQTCLFTAHPQESHIEGELSACLYSSDVKGLYISADSLALLSLETKPQHKGRQIVSHCEPVLCCGYSEEFRQVVSCSEGSVVKVWDVDTGAQVFEYGCAHGQAAITCMAFDSNGRRLEI
ncbi:WD repeat-containing protein 64 [Triplophysa tibetana]|uniref:WD repeat-containing protein 64 n=1 Tax=Triplophysa tibetana TaxID=1572043 RepID=A0A5A9MYS2_9TELE|nr:WD repeat-containing protein 64 [Triplophysa tibetana]